jgi:hypothetical protein
MNAGNILIRSGYVQSYSGGFGAGIGGGADGAGGLFFMDGGDVEAGSNRDSAGHGAGIGGGFNGVGGVVFVTSPESVDAPKPRLRAYSSRRGEGEGAGIGGGSGAVGGIVVINCHESLKSGEPGGGIEVYSSVEAVGRGAGIGGGFRGDGGTAVITDYKGAILAIESSGAPLIAAPGSGANIGAGFQGSNHGNQLVLTRSETGDRVVGNVILPDTILQYNINTDFFSLPYATILEYRIAEDDRLTVPEGSFLRIPLNVTLINNGEIENYGSIYNDWRFDGSKGKIINKSSIWTSGQLFEKGDYVGAEPITSTSASPVPAPTNPALPDLPVPVYRQLPAANSGEWVDYSRDGTAATLRLTPDRTSAIISASSDGTADIDLSGLDGLTEVAFPRQALIEFADKGLDVEFLMPRGTVRLSRAATRDIAGRGNNTQAYMRFRPANMQTLNAACLAALKDGDIVYELTMTIGGQNIGSFNGDITVTVPYTGASPVGAWYLDGNGRRKSTPSSSGDGSMSFIIHYFSLIAIGRDDASTTGSNTPWYYVQ